jgi:hypothetical protein
MHFSSPPCYLFPHMSKYSGLHEVFSTIGLCCSFHMRDTTTCKFTSFKTNSCTYFKSHTFTSTFIKTLKLVKNVCKSIIKNPTFFGHYCMAIVRRFPLYLVHLPLFRCLLRHLPFWYVAVCRLCVCVSGVPVCGLSGRHTHRRHTATYQ